MTAGGLVFNLGGEGRHEEHAAVIRAIREGESEWGHPVTDERGLFERVSLEAFQSGLSWLTILRKRENFRKAFAAFDFDKVAKFKDPQANALLAQLEKDLGVKVKSVTGTDGRARADRMIAGTDAPVVVTAVELEALGVDVIVTVGLDRVRHEERRERQPPPRAPPPQRRRP